MWTYNTYKVYEGKFLNLTKGSVSMQEVNSAVVEFLLSGIKALFLSASKDKEFVQEYKLFKSATFWRSLKTWGRLICTTGCLGWKNKEVNMGALMTQDFFPICSRWMF